ncbi:class I SAM-dependent methyltransferase [Actinoallomurus soli]|uniref:class I SAM-dependent methyltransferase n=1 Tax=Actinoallomurus soli TaxID=2952535 RepID=UPI002092AF4A|nr:class I SAM-dependent methyltransferase [Actinoallomurus soli]MCO5973923.1 class I SAM-dependent methyltransferase [Actinoallomurus soli]
MPDRAKVTLEGVPETLLWNLHQRATEARRPDAVLHDPKAVELVDALDYPFADRFGAAGLGQWQALRARCFDDEVRRFLGEHPDGQVVALGEGLETQFWRVDNGSVRWLTVDLPETIELRARLLPDDPPRRRTLAGSALDEEWTRHADPTDGLLLSAQGLLMYFEPDQVHRLLAMCAERFPGATMVFDGVPPWFSRRTVEGRMKNAQGYQAPPMPWAVDAAEKDRIRAIPNIAELRDLRPPRGRGPWHGALFPLLNHLRPIRELGVTGLPVMAVRFAPSEQEHRRR